MKHNRNFSVYTPVLLSVFLLLSILYSNETRADWNASTFGEKIAGTYLLTEEDDGGSRIVTITADGNWFGIHSSQLNNKFSNQQGVWKKTGEREITVRVLNFSSLKDGIGSSLFSFTVNLDKTYQQINGKLSGKLFSPGADPLDPVAIPLKSFSNTFTGKRLVINERESKF
jgi:hypothetical protein